MLPPLTHVAIMGQSDNLLDRLEKLLDRIELLVPDKKPVIAKKITPVMQWQGTARCRSLAAVNYHSSLQISDLLCVDRQKQALLDNTRQFLSGYPCNNVLLCGPRGTGKSSLVKTVAGHFADEGLVLVEIPRNMLTDLHEVCALVAGLDRQFIFFCDDLSFEADDAGYKSIKVILDGSVTILPDNTVVYATSNRRHLIPEYMSENLDSRMIDGEIHLNESLEEKLSLSERFGLWLSFQPFNQKQYLEIACYWLEKLGCPEAQSGNAKTAALQWALEKGSRSGRTAWQFARDWTGKHLLHG